MKLKKNSLNISIIAGSNISQVRIIHGFGSGALRKMTHEYLDTQKDVTYRPGHMNEGGGGATVVTF